MKGLIIKDVLTIKNNYKSIIVTLVLFTMLSLNGSSSLLVMLPLIGLMLYFSTFSYDEYNKWDAYAISLPNGRKNVVKAKYIGTLLLMALTLVLAVIIMFIISKFNTNLNFAESLYTLLGSTCGMMLFQSIMYPLVIKFGIEKGRIVLIIFVLAFSAATALFFQNAKMPNLDGLTKYITSIGPVVVIALLIISYLISRKAYNNKEF